MRTRVLVGFALALAVLPSAAEEPVPAEAPSAAQIREIVRRLGARYLDERTQAQEALAKLGAAAEPALLEALAADDFRIRTTACDLLGRLKSAAAVPRLVALLDDPDEPIRAAALDALARIGPPAHEAIRRARDAGVIAPETAAAIIEIPVKRAVEQLLDRCISADLGWGFYKDQFKDVVALGPPAAPVLLKLFLSPPADYEFTWTFEGETEDDRINRRKYIIHRLAGEALADLGERSVVPALEAEVKRLAAADVDPVDENDPRQDQFEMAAFALAKLGAPQAFGDLKDTLRRAAGARENGARLEVAFKDGDDDQQRLRQFMALSRLAACESRTENLAATEKVYAALLDLVPKEIQRLQTSGGNLLAQYRLKGLQVNAHYNQACTLAKLGRKPEAVRQLQAAVAEKYMDVDWIKKDGDLDAIRGEPEYQRLIAEVERVRRELDDARRGQRRID